MPEKDAVFSTVFGYQGDSPGHGIVGVSETDSLTVYLKFSACGTDNPEEAVGQEDASGTHQTGKDDDFTPPQVKIHTFENRLKGDVLHFHDDGAGFLSFATLESGGRGVERYIGIEYPRFIAVIQSCAADDTIDNTDIPQAVERI